MTEKISQLSLENKREIERAYYDAFGDNSIHIEAPKIGQISNGNIGIPVNNVWLKERVFGIIELNILLLLVIGIKVM